VRTCVAVGLILLFAMLGGAQAQQESSPLTLQRAVKIALEKNPARKVASADTLTALAQIKTASHISSRTGISLPPSWD